MNRILSLFLSIIFVFCAMPGVAYAEETAETMVFKTVEINKDGTFKLSDEVLFEGVVDKAVEYVNYTPEGGCVVIKKDIKLRKGLTVRPIEESAAFLLIDGDVTLDLNGYFITQLSGGNYSDNPLILVPKGSSLTIINSKEDKGGIINGVQFAVKVIGGTLNLNSGTIMAQSQASPFPDDAELPVRLTKGAAFNMSGGTIAYNGALDDGRTYADMSCAVYADESCNIDISGGQILGHVKFENKNNVHINGGIFGCDVSEMLSLVYGVLEKDGLFTVVKTLPEVYAEINGNAAEVQVSAEYHKTDERVTGFNVSVRSSGEEDETIRFDIWEIAKASIAYGMGKVPTIKISTDFASVTLDEEKIRNLYGNGLRKSMILFLEKKSQIDEEILSKLESVKYQIVCKVTDESGELISPDTKFNVDVFRNGTSSENSIQLYYVSGSSVLSKAATAKGKGFSCEALNNEKLLVSEGTVIMITGRTLDLQGTISMIFYASIEGVNPTNARMLFWDSPQPEYTEETADRIVPYSGKDSNGYRFKYENISSKDMNKEIYVRISAKDSKGNTIYGKAPTVGYSVVNYAQNMMQNKKLRPLLVKMLNYGAASQEYFGSEQEPANSVLTDIDRVMDLTKVYRSGAETISEKNTNEKCSSKIVGKTLTLEGDISINYYVSSNEKVDEIGILFWTEKAFKNTQKHIAGTQSGLTRTYTVNGGYRVFSFDNIVSRQMFDSVYARVYTRTGNVYRYSDIDKYSVRDYAANQIEKNEDPALIKLLRCLLLYGDEAERYFRLN